MSLYYVVKIFNEPQSSPDYLGPRPDTEHQYGVCGVEAAKRFLWAEEADQALREFMSVVENDRITYGQVFHVAEEPSGSRVYPGEAHQEPSEPTSESKIVEAAQDTSVDLDEGERLLAAADGTGNQEDDALHDWLYENAEELLRRARERDRLNWLRMNPEGCRAKKDCRNKRKEGWIHCELCLEDGNAGGYFDVYRSYYVQIYNDALEEILARIGKKIGLIQPEGSARPPDPESPRSPRSCPA